MAIYTKTGDKGKTGLLGGTRVEKTNQRVVAYGTVDELNSQIGLAISFSDKRTVKAKKLLVKIQQDLFEIASELATSTSVKPPFNLGLDRIRNLEKIIDGLEGSLPVLANFIFPGGSKMGAALHVTRSVCRRAEREIVKLAKKEKVNSNILVYVNRLSDFLFVLSREVNQLKGRKEEVWTGK